jgi:hypothetical protein
MEKPQIVYQYLKYSTFEDMIQNKTLKLSDIQCSNDTTELSIVFGVIKEVFWEEFNNAKKNKYFDEAVSEEDFNAFLQRNTAHIDGIQNITQTQFVSCFSEKKDLLSMWRGYAEDHWSNAKSVGGVAVGFSVEKLEQLVNANTASGEFSFGKVRYNRLKQKAIFRPHVIEEMAKIRAFVKKNKTIDGYDTPGFQLWYQDEVIRQGAYIKNNFFFEEQEWRLCHWGSRGYYLKEIHPIGLLLSNKIWFEKYQNINEENKKMLEESVRENLDYEPKAFPAQFFFLYMDNSVNDFIKEVIIGPKCKVDKKEVETLLRNNGISCDVHLSRGVNVFVDSINHMNA